MKRILALLLIAVVMFSFSGCGLVYMAGKYVGKLMAENKADFGDLPVESVAPSRSDGVQESPEPTEENVLPMPEEAPYLTVDYADEALLNSGNYYYLDAGKDEYVVNAAIYTNKTLKDLTLYDVFVSEHDTWVEIFKLEELDSQKPLVASLSFPGDMSAYGISFTDSAGNCQYFALYMSGLNGSLVLSACSEAPIITTAGSAFGE